MKVLSLFDGISAGQVALERAGIKVDNYYASEIDKYAVQVTMKNYPKTIQVGDVVSLDTSKLPKIDLLCGGSPCQSFSTAGNGKGFDGKSGLFWEYVRILKEVKPTYFMLENVVMKKEWEDIITEALGVKPIKINSRLLSAQNRQRLYWTNIPNIQQPEDKKIIFKDILDFINTDKYILSDKAIKYIEVKNPKNDDIDYVVCANRTISTDKTGTLTQRYYKGIENFGTNPFHYKNGVYRKLTPNECERLQTIPLNYTDSVSDTQRYKMLGNGWTVDVVAHIFKNLQ